MIRLIHRLRSSGPLQGANSPGWLLLVALAAALLPGTDSCSVAQVSKAAPATAPAASPQGSATRESTTPSAVATSQPGTVIHIARRGESVGALLRMYLPKTAYMTRPELEVAIRQANAGLRGNVLKAGEAVVIPGIESSPVVERAIPVPRDFEVRAVYLTGAMAGSERGIRLIWRWRQMGGNSVVFDIKDSDGIVNVDFPHPLSGSTRRPAISNLPKFVRFLHSLNMHAIARIAIFRDERLVKHHPELAVHSRSSGQPWRENGKLVWTDPSRSQVQEYNIALADYAAQAGVDEIQFDYVRFPAEGNQKDASFVFQSEHPGWKRSDAIAHFLKKAYDTLHPQGVLLSLDVFGVMAWQRPVDLSHTGQDIVAMAQYCDVLSPMIYPSHFFGMDGYKRPGDAPEHFISESMDRFRLITRGSGVVLRPWLQAFAWRTRTYSTQYIVTQVNTARREGGIGFLFWNARNDYHKPLLAMAEMRSTPGRFFRGDELPAAATPAARVVRTSASAPANVIP